MQVSQEAAPAKADLMEARKRSRSSAKRAGWWMERTWTDLLKAHGFDADRLRLRGSKDIGDVGAPELRDCVFECKNTARMDLPSGWAETEREMANAGARFGFLIVKRHGNAKPTEQWAVMTTGQLVELLALLKEK